MRAAVVFLVLVACDPIELDVRGAQLPVPSISSPCTDAGRVCVPDETESRFCPDGSLPFSESCGDLSPALCCTQRVLSECEMGMGQCFSSAFGGCPPSFNQAISSCDAAGREPGNICCTPVPVSPCELEGHFCYPDDLSGVCPPGTNPEPDVCYFNPTSRICCSPM